MNTTITEPPSLSSSSIFYHLSPEVMTNEIHQDHHYHRPSYKKSEVSLLSLLFSIASSSEVMMGEVFSCLYFLSPFTHFLHFKFCGSDCLFYFRRCSDERRGRNTTSITALLCCLHWIKFFIFILLCFCTDILGK